MPDTVTISISLVVVAAVLAAAYGLKSQQPLFAAFPVLGGFLAIAMFFAGPRSNAEARMPMVPPNLGGAANFLDRWQKDQAWYGEPFAFELRNGIPTLWTSQCMLEAHQEISDPYWATQCGNAGLLVAQKRGVQITPGVSFPPAINAWAATQKIDLVYWIGDALTPPIKQGDSWIVYTHKTILEFPGSSLEGTSDPASVKRLPAGRILYEIMHGADPEDPWTTGRKTLLTIACISLLVSFVAPRILSIWHPNYGNYQGF